jgi:hypothetical protein
MKKSKPRKRASHKHKELLVREVEEIIKRHHPRLSNSVLIYSPCGMVRACVQFKRTIGSRFPFFPATRPEFGPARVGIIRVL